MIITCKCSNSYFSPYLLVAMSTYYSKLQALHFKIEKWIRIGQRFQNTSDVD